MINHYRYLCIKVTLFLLFTSQIVWANHIVVGLKKGKYSEKTSETIQKAIDEVASLGGGTVELAKGEYIVHSTIYVKSHVTLCGQGSKTVLKKTPFYSQSSLLKPAKVGDRIIYVERSYEFYEGQGVNIGDEKVRANDTTLTKIKKIEGNKIFIEDPIGVSCEKNAYIASNFSCIFVKFASHVTIRNLVIDGSRDFSPFIYSWKIGGLKTWEAPYIWLDKLEIRNTCGDGLTLGRSNFAIVSRLYCHHNDLIGIHLANGSTNVMTCDCVAHDAGRRDSFNGAGIFLCWNVQDSIVQNNFSYNNKGGGISIGRNDSNNLFINNALYSNENGGIRFRSDARGICKNNSFIATMVKDNSPVDVLIEGEPESVFFDHSDASFTKESYVRTLSLADLIDPSAPILYKRNPRFQTVRCSGHLGFKKSNRT